MRALLPVHVGVVQVQSLDLFDQSRRGVGHSFGALDELFLGHGICSFRTGDSAGVAEGAGVLGYESRGFEDMFLGTGGRRQSRTALVDGLGGTSELSLVD